MFSPKQDINIMPIHEDLRVFFRKKGWKVARRRGAISYQQGEKLQE